MIKHSLNGAASKILSQGIVFLSLPIITTIYSAAEIGKAFIIIAAATILASVSTLGLNLILPITKSYSLTIPIVRFGILISGIMGIIGSFIISLLLNDTFNYLVFTICFLYILGSVILNLSIQLAIRTKSYNKLNTVYAAQPILTTLGIILFGFFISNSWVSYIGANFVGALLPLLITRNITLQHVFGPISVLKLAYILKKYSNIFTFGVPTTLLNISAGRLPLILIATYYSFELSGLYGIAEKVALAPVVLCSSALGNILVGEIADAQRNNNQRYSLIFQKALQISVILALLVSLIVFTFSSEIADFIYSSEKEDVGLLLKLLTIFMFFRIIASSTSRVFTVFRKLHLAFLWNLMRSIVFFITFWLSIQIDLKFETTILMFALLSALLDVLITIIAWKLCSKIGM